MTNDIKYNTTRSGNLDNLKATDDATTLIHSYDNSKPKDGWFRRYWPNDNLRYEWKYKNGKRADGVAKGWWANGNLKQTIDYKDGKYNGLKIGWYESGNIKSEVVYKNGTFDGLWHYWHENGQYAQEISYDYGKRISKRAWDEDGKLIESVGDFPTEKEKRWKWEITYPIRINQPSRKSTTLSIASTFRVPTGHGFRVPPRKIVNKNPIEINNFKPK